MTPQPTPCATGRPRIGWVVDVQRDFMVPPSEGGRLYVKHLTDPADPGAQRAAPAIAAAARWMGAHCEALVFTGDWHGDGDPEIDRAAPDYRATYPAHCMGESLDPAERAGAALLPAVQPDRRMAVLGRHAGAAAVKAVARHAAAGQPVFLQKSRFSVFEGQPRTDDFLTLLAAHLGATPEVIVCGVSTDVCVRWAVEGFLDRKHPVTVVTDATWGLGLVPEATLFAAWAARGARLVTTAELPTLARTAGVAA